MTPYSKRGVAGLINLGNTCYMNSGLQCIAHIKEIVDYFLNNKHLPEINMVNPLGTKGELASNFGKFVQQLYFGNSSCCNPAALKRAISRFAPMFSGYMQHDAGELINYLLDGLHEDLNRVYDKPYV